MSGGHTHCKKTLTVNAAGSEEDAIEQIKLMCYLWCTKALDCIDKVAHQKVNPRLLPLPPLPELVAARPPQRRLREWRRGELVRRAAEDP